ncbi:MAG: DinB family protein [Hyphomicrobiales bacterium]
MTTPNPEFERIRSYLQAQASKLSIPDLVEKVRTDMGQLRAAIEAVPADGFGRRPAEGEWSANEILAHLLASSADVARGIVTVLDGGAPPERVADAIKGTTEQRTGSEWWQALRDDRERLFERVSKARGDERLDVTWLHPMFGQLNWREWLLFTRIHDLDHARQLQANQAALASS